MFLLVEWPSREAADAFYESPGYRPFRTARLEGSEGQLFIIAGEDVAKRARIS